jgi:phosphate ABC transporter permease protein PstC
LVDREWIIKKVLAVLSMLVVVGILLIVVFVTKAALPVITKVGLFNLFSSNWYPPTGHYGIMIFIVGTLLTTVGGLLIGAPLALGTALFLTEMAPRRAATIVTRGVEVLAGIPSIVLGWLGLIILLPWIKALTRTGGTGIFAASIILGIMVMPTITTIAKDALETVPADYRLGSIGLGATRWQTTWRVTLPAAKSGIIVAVILGMGRAIGETMAVALVIGPATSYAKGLFSPTHTLTTKMLMEMGESSGIQRSALFFMALVLLLIAIALIALIRVASRKKAYAR